MSDIGAMFFGAAMLVIPTLMGVAVWDGIREGQEARHKALFTPLCVKERSALECEALWQGIEVK